MLVEKRLSRIYLRKVSLISGWKIPRLLLLTRLSIVRLHVISGLLDHLSVFHNLSLIPWKLSVFNDMILCSRNYIYQALFVHVKEHIIDVCIVDHHSSKVICLTFHLFI